MIVTEVAMNDYRNYGGSDNRGYTPEGEVRYGGFGTRYGVGGEGGGYGRPQNGGRTDGSMSGDIPQDVAERAAQYSTMSREELSEELMREASSLRAQGLLDVGRLVEFCRMAAPYMTAEQVRRMREIIGMLR